MRARYPDTGGFIERGGVKVGYEVFGAGEPAILLLTSWAIVHARRWKAPVPYLARRFRVIAVEGRGNGRAGRPATAEDYSDREYVDDAIAVLDAAGVDRAVVVGLSLGGRHALQLTAWYPERAAGVIAIGAALPRPVRRTSTSRRTATRAGARRTGTTGWPATAAGQRQGEAVAVRLQRPEYPKHRCCVHRDPLSQR